MGVLGRGVGVRVGVIEMMVEGVGVGLTVGNWFTPSHQSCIRGSMKVPLSLIETFTSFTRAFPRYCRPWRKGNVTLPCALRFR